MKRSFVVNGTLVVGGLLLLGASALLLLGAGKDPRTEASPSADSVKEGTKRVTTKAVAAEANFVADDAGHQQIAVPFLKQHCLKCHGPDLQEADFRVDQHLTNEFLTRSVAERWSEVLNRLNGGEMPPREEPRPPADDVAKIVDWISRERLRGEKSRRGTEIVLRRLNRAEYNNTIRDLTGVDMQPADEFPADPPAGGFDNNGGVLTMSQLQMELYIKAAQQVLDRAIVTEKERPPSIKWRFQIDEGFREMNGEVPPDHVVKFDGQSMSVNPGCNSIRNGMTVLRQPAWNTCGDARFGNFEVPHAGYYVVRMRAAGAVPPPEDVLRFAMDWHERKQQDDENKLTDPEQRRTFREGFEQHTRANIKKEFSSRHYSYGPPRIKLTNQASGVDRILGEFDVAAPENDPGIYEVRAWFAPAGAAWITFNNVYQIPRNGWNGWLQGTKDFPRPELLVDWMELEGPLYDSWPPSSHRQILIDSPNKDRDEEA